MLPWYFKLYIYAKKKLREKMHENVRYEKIYYAEIEEKRDNSWDSVLVNPGSGSTYVSPRSSPDIIKITLHYVK